MSQPLRSEFDFDKSNPSLRICFVAHGGFAHVDAYIDYFREHHQVCLVALAPGPKRDIPTYEVGVSSPLFKLLGKIGYLPAALRTRRVLRELRPDIVHAHYATSAGLAAFIADVHPWVITAHGTDVTLGANSWVWRRLLRTFFNRAEAVNVVSEELRELVLALGTVAEKVQSFSLGINTEHFDFQPRVSSFPAEPLRLVCTRRLEPVYDHATVLKALAVLKQRGTPCTLTILGDGIGGAALKALAADLGVLDRVSFAGEFPNESLPSLLHAHDVYLSASKRDGTSLCLLEAMASGVYPIVSRIRANTDWLEHGKNGLLHEVGNSASLADCIGAYLQEPSAQREGLAANRQLVIRRAERRTNMQRLEQLYFSIARQVPQSARAARLSIAPRANMPALTKTNLL